MSKRAPRRGGGEEEERKYLWMEGRKFVKSRGIGNHVFFPSLQRDVMESFKFCRYLFVTRNESSVCLFIVRASNRRALNRREEREN